MEFLKEILGDELYTQLEGKINEYNSLEANKEKQIKLVNSENGEYISKSEYDALNETLKGTQTELDTANTLAIVIFKKALCTSGFEINTKNKEAAVNKYTFEAYAEMSDENVETLPVEVIINPTL